MAIFKIQNKNLTEIKSKIFPTERELQELVDDNLDKIFGLEFIKREFGGQGLSIDTIAYDPQTKSPVLIEYKKDTYQSVIDQGMAYLHWLLNHKGDYQIALNAKLGHQEVDWSQPRVIFIARSFNPHQIYASGFRNAPFELCRYDLCGDIFLLEPIETPKSDVSITAVLRNKEVAEVVRNIETYTIEDHLARGSDVTRGLFDKLKKSIFSLDDQIRENPVKYYIGYKFRNRNFCSIKIRQRTIIVNVLMDNIKDIQGKFKLNPYKYRLGKTRLWETRLTSEEGLNYVLGIIKQAYQSAPDL